jgi:pSer/pThr/pTyr-binding forkhead associated (FHA) protein
MNAVIVLILRLVIAIILYAFIAYALYNIWQDLHFQGKILGQRKIPTLILVPLDQMDDPPHSYRLPEVIIGRNPECDFQIQNNTVSAEHARMSYHHNQWWVEDLQSKNGTFLNDEQLYTPTVAISNDELRCGGIHLKIIIQHDD